MLSFFKSLLHEIKEFILFKGWTWSTIVLTAILGLYPLRLILQIKLWHALTPSWWIPDGQFFINAFMLIAAVAIGSYPFLFLHNLLTKYLVKNPIMRVVLILVFVFMIAAGFLIVTLFTFM